MKSQENDIVSNRMTSGSTSAKKDESQSEGREGAPQIPCAREVEKVLTIPANALLSKVKVNIVAMPAGECPLKEAGEVRNSQGDDKKAIIDLKRMRSVSGLTSPQAITDIYTWAGAEFKDERIDVDSGKKNVLFSEVATERLQVTFNDDANLEEFLEKGSIILPDTPADLILTVNDKSAWTHLGPVTLSSNEKPAQDFTVILDEKAKRELIKALKEKLQDVISSVHSVEEIFRLLSKYDISISDSGKKGLIDALKTKSGATPFGKPSFEETLRGKSDPAFDLSDEQALEKWLMSLGVTWEGNDAAAVSGIPSFSEDVDIKDLLQTEIDAGAAELKIVLRSAFACRLQMKMTSEEYLLNHDVVFPAQAQVLEIAKEGIATLFLPMPGISSSWSVTSLFFTLEGNNGRSRFYPAVGPDPIPLGELLLDSDHALAASLTASSLSKFNKIEGIRLPLQVEEDGAEITAFLRKDDSGKVGAYLDEGTLTSQTIAQTKEQWVLLELGKPMDIQPETDLWLEINAIRGKCWWQLGSKNDSSEGIVRLQRGVPGGTFSPFSLVLDGQLENLMGRLRIKGQPVTDGAIHAIVPIDPQSGEKLGGITVGNAPIPVELKFNHAIQPVDEKLNLDFQVHCPGTYTVTEARVLYKT